jgi:predicted ATPase
MPRMRPSDFFYSERERRKNARLLTLRLRNFKSVVDQEINLSPLTIIVGKNSSGKSTVLQSILFLAQNASNPLNRNLAEEGNLDLNGELVSLGVYKEAKNDRTKTEVPFSIGGTFEFDYGQNMEYQSVDLQAGGKDENFPGRTGVLSWDTELQGLDRNNDASIVTSISGKGSLEFGGKVVQSIDSHRAEPENVEDLLDFMESESKQGELVPDIWAGLSIFSEATLLSQGKLHGGLERPGMSLNSRFANLNAVTDLHGVKHVLGIPVNGLTYTSRYTFLLNRQKNFFDGNRLRSNINGILFNLQRWMSSRIEEGVGQSLQRFDSQDLTTISDGVERYIEKARSFLQEESTWITAKEYDATSRPLLRIESLPLKIRSAMKPALSEEIPLEIKNANTGIDGWVEFPLNQLPIFIKYIVFDRVDLANQIVEQVRDFWKEVEGQLVSHFSSFAYNGISDVLVPASLNDDATATGEGLAPDEFEIGDAVTRFSNFLEDLVYLGPLRLEPSDIYKRTLGSRVSQLPLGMQGEHLARVVSENPSAKYPLPPESKLVPINGETYFKDALNDWLKWLGIATTGVDVTTDRHYGYRLTVDRRYLRSLGVGVSQVIPVIGVCLLAEAGSLVLLEEPELHLNPNIQQKLADFFLAMSESGRQLIVETHSEYLITRLRLRSMQKPEISNSFSFVFTEQEHEDWNPVSAKSPYTVYRTVRPDEKGELPEWPAGFFDQVTTDVQALLDEMIKRESK